MAVSDDVVRAGLTSKHVDPTALAEVLRTDRGDVVESPTGPVHRYAAGQAEDQIGEVGAVLWRLTGDGLDVDLSDRRGPELVICTQGTALIGAAGDGPDLVVGSGEAAWIGLDDGPARMRVDGTVHRVTVGEG
jgi:mannose-6-phosphate isomerase